MDAIVRDDVRLPRLFLLIAPIIFAAYALLTPPFHTFDENQHLYRAWQVSSLQLTGEPRGSESGGELPPGLAPATLQEIGSIVPQGQRIAVVRPLSEIFGRNTPIGLDRPPVYYNFFGAVLYSPASYIPQAVAVRMGETVGLSVEWTLRLGRLLNGAVCIGLIWWAMTLIPYGRRIMLTMALLPPTAAGAASFGQDGLVIGTGFLLTAMGLKVATEKRWSFVSAAAVGVGGATITLLKFVYLPLVAVAALPKPTESSWRRWVAVPLLSGLVAAILLLAWFQINAHAIVTFRSTVPPISEQVGWILAHPFGYCTLVARTYFASLPFMWADLYEFGDSTVPIIVPAAIAGTLATLGAMTDGEDRNIDLSRSRRAWMILIFIGVAVLIATALFLADTRRGAYYIHGIQGRYFLPVLPLLAIALTRRGDRGPAMLVPAIVMLIVVAHVATLGTIMSIFYTF